MPKKFFVISILIILASLALAACGGAGLDPTDVTIDISIIEIKGSTDGIDPPSVDPATLSDGYGFKGPGEYDADNPNKWQVATYLFSPSALTVGVGDAVTLRTFVINGDNHTVWLEAPDGSVAGSEVTMNRGREYNFEFTADQSGYYTLHCDDHEPTMTMTVLALP